MIINDPVQCLVCRGCNFFPIQTLIIAYDRIQKKSHSFSLSNTIDLTGVYRYARAVIFKFETPRETCSRHTILPGKNAFSSSVRLRRDRVDRMRGRKSRGRPERRCRISRTRAKKNRLSKPVKAKPDRNGNRLVSKIMKRVPGF